MNEDGDVDGDAGGVADAAAAEPDEFGNAHLDEEAAGDQDGDAAEDQAGGERRQEGVDVQPGDDQAVDDAEEEADEGGGDEAEDGIDIDREPGGRDRGDAEDRAGREIEAAADDHQGQRGGDEGERRRLVEDVEEVARRQEGVADQAHIDHQRDDDDDHRVVADEAPEAVPVETEAHAGTASAVIRPRSISKSRKSTSSTVVAFGSTSPTIRPRLMR